MHEEKVINNEIVRRSKRYPNYGVTIEGIPYRWDTCKPMKIRLIGGYKEDKYLGFRVCHDNKAGTAYLHAVVAECWIPNDNPLTKTQVNHIDGDKRNPSVDNLEWCTPANNLQHSSIVLGHKGADRYNATLVDDQVHQVCQLLQEGIRCVDIADMFSVSTDIIRKIKSGSCYFHVRRLYNISNEYISDFSETTVRWVCEQILKGISDSNIAKNSTNNSLKTIDVKRIRYKIRYKTISDEYFGDPFND